MVYNNLSFYDSVEFTTFVETFVKQCEEKFNKKVEVIPQKIEVINLNVLLDAANQILGEYSKEYKDGIKVKSRLRHIIFIRQAFAKVCFDNGVKKYQIGNFLGLHRCTIIHGIRSAVDLLEVKHKEFTETYTKLLFLYNEKYKEYLCSINNDAINRVSS